MLLKVLAEFNVLGLFGFQGLTSAWGCKDPRYCLGFRAETQAVFHVSFFPPSLPSNDSFLPHASPKPRRLKLPEPILKDPKP